MTNRLESKMQEWIEKNPRYQKFGENLRTILYAREHPEEFDLPPEIVSYEFVLKKSPIFLDSQKIIPDYENKILEFTLKKGYGTYIGKKFGWNGNYIGLNRLILKFAISVGFTLKIITPKEICYIDKNAIETTIKEKWIVTRKYKLTIYAIPLNLTHKKESKLLVKINNFF